MQDVDKILDKLNQLEVQLLQKLSSIKVSEQKNMWSATHNIALAQLLEIYKAKIPEFVASIRLDNIPEISEKIANRAVDAFNKRFNQESQNA